MASSWVVNLLSCCTTAHSQQTANEFNLTRPLIASHKRHRFDLRRPSACSHSEDAHGVVSLVQPRTTRDAETPNVPRHVKIMLEESHHESSSPPQSSHGQDLTRENSDVPLSARTRTSSNQRETPRTSSNQIETLRTSSNQREILRTSSNQRETPQLTSRQADLPSAGGNALLSHRSEKSLEQRPSFRRNDLQTPTVLKRVISKSHSAAINFSRPTESKPQAMKNASYLTSPQSLRRSRARTPKPHSPPEAFNLVKVTMSDFTASAFYKTFSQALKKAGIDGTRSPRDSSASPRFETMDLLRVAGEALYNGTLRVDHNGVTSNLNCNADLSTFWWNDPQRKLLQTKDIKQSLHWVQILQLSSLHPFFTKPPLMNLKESERRNLVMVEYLDHALTLQRAWWVMQTTLEAKSLAVLLRCLSSFSK